ncbi:MAG: putative membrane protein, partial [Candidatus Poriferisodalaceae bacterium]
MGAHVWGPAFLRDELLPNFQLRGWSGDWYAGFPAMHFYMFLPYLAIVAVDLLLPYGVAFKLVAVAGVALMPAAAWFLARLSRWPFPLPALSAVAGFLFVFDFNFTIYGGNIASTLAGEFAFSIGLACTLVYLGLVYRAIEVNELRTLASVALAVVALCHLVTLIFAIAGTVLMVLAAGIHRIPKLLGVSKAWLLFSSFAVAEIVLWRLLDQPFAALMVALFFVLGLLCLEFRGAFRALTVGLL